MNQSPVGAGRTQPTARSIFESLRGYKMTAVLRAAVELRVFDELAEEPRPGQELANCLGVEVRALTPLLGALVAMGLARGDGAGYSAVAEAGILQTTSGDYIGGLAEIVAGATEWQAMGRLAETIRSDRPLPGMDATAPGFDYWAQFAGSRTLAAEATARLCCESLASRIPSSTELRILDGGCGAGTCGFALASQFPRARLDLLDRSEVLERAREGMPDVLDTRTAFLEGDLLDPQIEGSYDAIVLSNVLFLFSAATAMTVLERSAAALNPGGFLLVAGLMADTGHPSELDLQLLDLQLLSWTAEGRVHAVQDYQHWLTYLGFDHVTTLEAPAGPSKLVLAGPR